MTAESKLREQIVLFGKSLYDRGLTHGSTGNISVRLDDGWLMTPTGSSLGWLDPANLSKLDQDGVLVSGPAPTKEFFLHRAVYDERNDAGAIVHLHSTHSVAVSCLPDTDPDCALPPLTPYSLMQCGRIPMLPYFKPGDLALADAIRGVAGKHSAVLLANHGPIVAGKSLETAMYATEELEATAKLHLLTRGLNPRLLTPDQIAALS
ncbi:MAG: 3-oxo-tetronate 4-phosphate decarboxylase [Alphaproteobacteria bacterium]